MSEGIKVDTEEWKREAAKLLDVERPIVLAMRREVRSLARPVAQAILEAYAQAMPHRGGLAQRILNRGSISILTNLRSGVQLKIGNKDGIYLEAVERGTIRRPTFGHLPWKSQSVPADVGSEEFEKRADGMRRDVLNALERAIRENT